MFRPRRYHGQGARGPGMGIFLLAAQILNVGVDRVPPVTLFLIASQVALFLRLIVLPFGGLQNVCISSLAVWYNDDWKRLVLASFYHGSEWHLYYNMASLLWKGINVERRVGSPYFAYMVAVFSLLINVVMVAVGVLASEVTGDGSYVRECAVGFSGVLFALKVVASHINPATTSYIMGLFPLPSRIACWGELILIHILVPNASFIGHLSGILVGLLYTSGPLKSAMDMFVPAAPSYTYRADVTGYRSGQRLTERSPERSGGRMDEYTAGLSEDEQMQRAMEDSLRHNQNNSATAPEYEPDTLPYPTNAHHGNIPMPDPPPYPGTSHATPPYPRSSQATPPYPSSAQVTPPYPSSTNSLYPNIDSMMAASQNSENEEIRRRRLQRFT